jgi:hypothetical protein
MSELRAPDPTLSALNLDVIVTRWSGDRGPAVAHLFVDDVDTLSGLCGVELECGPQLKAPYPWGSEDARWFAVPCRECFPDAPPPGHVATASRFKPHERDPHLSWQVQR